MSRKRKSDFMKLRGKFGLSVTTAAGLFEVTERTIRNWDRDGAPRLAMRLLWERQGRLDALHPDWQGFRIGGNGKLYGPNRLQFSAEYLRHWREVLRCPCCSKMPEGVELP